MTTIEMTDDPICPYCGHKETDAWEIDFGGVDGSTEISCGNCGEDYDVERIAIFYYSTRKLLGNNP